MTNLAEKTKKSTKIAAVEMEEYKALRAEIITYISAKQNLIYLSVLVILALLGLQITTKLCLFSLCTLITIIVFYIQDFNYKIGIAECGAYIRAKFENKYEDLSWETTLSKLNMRYDKQKGKRKITWTKKYKRHFRSIFDSGVINHFTVFSLISLIVGWYPILEKFQQSKDCLERFWENETLGVLIMSLSSVISLAFFATLIVIQRRDFNRIRKEFYINIKKIIRKSKKVKK